MRDSNVGWNCDYLDWGFPRISSVRPRKCADRTLRKATAESLHIPSTMTFILPSHANQHVTNNVVKQSKKKKTKKIWHLFTIRCSMASLSLTACARMWQKGPWPTLHPLTPELNPSAQRCLTIFFNGDFASWAVHFVNICVKNQQM
jgi:hypothetical protein